MTVSEQDLQRGFRDLKLGNSPVIVHASLSAFGPVEDGPETVLAALMAVFKTIVMPTFTYKTMITPPVGPQENALVYGSGRDLNAMAEFFTPDMPADPLMGILPETLRRHPLARRSMHPIQSFAGINAEKILASQSLLTSLAPLGELEKQNGWAVLLGVDHTVNTSIHYAEKLAGRKQFLRWALTPAGVVECPGFPGDSAGFQAVAPEMDKFTRRAQVGKALVQAVPLRTLFKVVIAMIKNDPLALLCQREDCERCNQMRSMLKK
ncbi:MAG TPA: AAC(3) family N-acetyltransferase [Anaerolineales bacterium]|nr:AAC(3) family N-acetyltransferase [Anaerolineales bacterium]